MFLYLEMYDGNKEAWQIMLSTYAYTGEATHYMYVCYIYVSTNLHVYMYTQVLTTHMYVFIYGST